MNLTIFDLLGRKVNTLVAEQLPGGHYSVVSGIDRENIYLEDPSLVAVGHLDEDDRPEVLVADFKVLYALDAELHEPLNQTLAVVASTRKEAAARDFQRARGGVVLRWSELTEGRDERRE